MEPFRTPYSVTAPTSRGVTLVELLVVLGIIGVLTSVVITSRGSFNKTILLTNTAFDIALTIRSAETFGLGSRATIGSIANAGYGVHFTATPTTPGTSFTLFADTNAPPSACHPTPGGPGAGSPTETPGDCAYTPPPATPPDEVVQTYALGNGMKISDMCAYTATPPTTTNPATCTAHLVDSTHTQGLTSLDVVFSRPNTATYVSANGIYSAAITRACITVTSPQGGGSYVYVEPTGEVHVSATPCP
jgi:prepilin-type N-terminal cleavage/methylation domain-containing protein